MEKEKLSWFEKALVKSGIASVDKTQNSTQKEVDEIEEVPSASLASKSSLEPDTIKGIVDPKIRETLEQELKNFNNQDSRTQGIDFYEFKEGLKIAQGATIESKAANAFRTAQAFSSGSLTKAKLLETAKLYQEIIESEAEGFESHVEALTLETLGPQEEEVKKLKEELVDIDKQIEALNNQKTENIKRINNLEGEVYVERKNISQKVLNFEVTLLEFINEHKEAVKAVESLPEDSSASV